MMRLVRKHIAEHRRAGRPRLRPTTSRKLGDAPIPAVRQCVLQHFQASRRTLAMRGARLLDRATRRVQPLWTLQMWRGVSDPAQTVVMQVGENSGKGTPLVRVFSLWATAPRLRVKVRQQKLIHRVIRGVSLQQDFAKLIFRAASRLRTSHSLRSNLALGL